MYRVKYKVVRTSDGAVEIVNGQQSGVYDVELWEWQSRAKEFWFTEVVKSVARLKSAQRTALMPYVVVGHPTREATPAIVSALIEAGADIVELGVPFSDPLADGPVIQRATHQSLLGGTTPRDCLSIAAAIRARHPQTPLLFMGYYNPILRFGVAAYARACAEAGIDGLIVPDLPLEESAELLASAARERARPDPAGGPHQR